MSFNFIKNKNVLYGIPYLALLALGVWYRYKISGPAFFDDDSANYLLPPFKKVLTGEWHKGERPMQYLLFIYFTVTEYAGIKYTIIAQQVLGICSAGLLTAAWVIYVSTFKTRQFLWHLMGYTMLSIYISSPFAMYYEQFIGPESPSIFVMSLLIFCLAVVFRRGNSNIIQAVFYGMALFVNLYLANPMPKWIFAAGFLEVTLIVMVFRSRQLSQSSKALILIIPHLLYGLVVYLPESIHRIDSPAESRVYIEYEQMVYTHFDLLAQDKTNFGLRPPLQDSLMLYFKQAARPGALFKFDSDPLMWGPANYLIYNYYHKDYDSIEKYFIHLNRILGTKYPVGLAGEIGKQVCSMYIPNKTVHKDLFGFPEIFSLSYSGNSFRVKSFDQDLLGNLMVDTLLPEKSSNGYPSYSRVRHYLLGPKLNEAQNLAAVNTAGALPLLYTKFFPGFYYFDYIFLFVMLLFFALNTYLQKGLRCNLISLLYLLIFIYVLTVGTVHTFDEGRFIFTIYPFMLLTPFLALAFIVNYVLNKYFAGWDK